jgi:hypothetical protein
MSDKKTYSPAEVARMILEKAHNTLKKHEEMLQKSKNTAHEIDAGEEPKNDEAECPESLKGEGASSASKSEPKKEKSPVAESEDSEMEDEPLSDDESEEESDENEEEDEEESEYEFRKSESGMHTVQYKTLVKKEQPLKKLMSSNSTMPGSVATTGGPSIGSQIGFPGIKKEEDPEMVRDPKENAPTHIKRRGEKAGKSKALTPAQRAAGFGQAFKPGQKTSNTGQFDRIKEIRDKKNKEN